MLKLSVQPSQYLFGQGVAYAPATAFLAGRSTPYRLAGVPPSYGVAIAPDSEVRGVRIKDPQAPGFIDVVEGAPVAAPFAGQVMLEPLRGYRHDGRLTLCFAETPLEVAALPMHIAARPALSFNDLDPETNVGDRFRLVSVAAAAALAAQPQIQATLWLDGGSSGSGAANVRAYRVDEHGALADYITASFAWPAASGEVNLSVPACEVAAIELYSGAGYGPLSGLVVVA